ncbi:MAG: hypothetical protein F4030_13310 [Gammaproteobacteria bacterium]|nr:hypothetical protein [Gammaproteobacteria bacterium]MYH86449.1 hypothetical protein [Gammaproteobacteria bacterium]MYK05952.1 hypothetical protein [Gammaproteobacteria bacterium]
MKHLVCAFGAHPSFKLLRQFFLPSLLSLGLQVHAQAASSQTSFLWSETSPAGLAGLTTSRLTGSTPLCSAYTAAPTDAQSLSAGTHTFFVTGSVSGTIWGTGTYTDDSRIATAAVHDGHVAAGGKAVVRLTKSGGRTSYTGSTKNGVTSRNYGSWTGSYTLAFVSACTTSTTTTPKPKPDPTPTPTSLNCSSYTAAPSNATSLSNGTHSFVVTGSSTGSVWGTGTYTDDSPIGTAAVHDGHVAVGGKAAISLNKFGGQSSYTGSTKNGITTSSYGSWTGSYTLSLLGACSTTTTPDPTPDPPATSSAPDTDGDGTIDSEDTDDDNDGMPDVWEIENDFNPLSAVDAALDADGDNHNNLAEFNGGSDPHWTLSTPGNLPEILPGFNDNYTAQKGLIDSDTLPDILVRNPVPGVVPAVSDFVLIQKAAGGFSLEDAADHTIPSASNLTSADSAVRLRDLNGDGVTDMLLAGLDTHIEDAADQIVFSGHEDIYEIPGAHVAAGKSFKKYFSDLAKWVRNPAYLEGPLSTGQKLPVVKRDENPNEEEFLLGSSGSTAYSVYGTTTMEEHYWNQHILNCIGYSSVFCLTLGDNGQFLGLQSLLYKGILFSSGRPYEIVVSIPTGAPQVPPDLEMYNTSKFDYDARLLALNYLRQFRDSRTLDPGSNTAKVISETLEAILGVEVFEGILEEVGLDFPVSIDSFCEVAGVDCDIVTVLEYILGSIRQALLKCSSTDIDDCEVVPASVLDVQPVVPDDESDPYVVITKPGTDELVISTVPKMPAATFNAEVKGLSGSNYEIGYAWNAVLYYRGTGKKSQTLVTNREVTEKDEDGNTVTKTVAKKTRYWVPERHDFMERIPTVGAVPGLVGTSVFNNNWIIPWGDVLQGGSLTVQVTATISSGGTQIAKVSNQQVYPITGSNPSLAQMKGIIGNSDLKLAVAWAESTHRQFDGVKYTGTGIPVYGEPDGWGLMQIDNIPMVPKTVEHFWNWRVNLKTGSDYLEQNYSDALTWLIGRYNFVQNDRDKENDWTADWLPSEASEKDSVKELIWNDALARYNSGRTIYSPNGNKGFTHCEKHKEHEFDRKGVIDDHYANPAGCRYYRAIRKAMKDKEWTK